MPRKARKRKLNKTKTNDKAHPSLKGRVDGLNDAECSSSTPSFPKKMCLEKTNSSITENQDCVDSARSLRRKFAKPIATASTHFSESSDNQSRTDDQTVHPRVGLDKMAMEAEATDGYAKLFDDKKQACLIDTEVMEGESCEHKNSESEMEPVREVMPDCMDSIGKGKQKAGAKSAESCGIKQGVGLAGIAEEVEPVLSEEKVKTVVKSAESCGIKPAVGMVRIAEEIKQELNIVGEKMKTCAVKPAVVLPIVRIDQEVEQEFNIDTEKVKTLVNAVESAVRIVAEETEQEFDKEKVEGKVVEPCEIKATVNSETKSVEKAKGLDCSILKDELNSEGIGNSDEMAKSEEQLMLSDTLGRESNSCNPLGTELNRTLAIGSELDSGIMLATESNRKDPTISIEQSVESNVEKTPVNIEQSAAVALEHRPSETIENSTQKLQDTVVTAEVKYIGEENQLGQPPIENIENNSTRKLQDAWITAELGEEDQVHPHSSKSFPVTKRMNETLKQLVDLTQEQVDELDWNRRTGDDEAAVTTKDKMVTICRSYHQKNYEEAWEEASMGYDPHNGHSYPSFTNDDGTPRAIYSSQKLEALFCSGELNSPMENVIRSGMGSVSKRIGKTEASEIVDKCKQDRGLSNQTEKMSEIDDKRKQEEGVLRHSHNSVAQLAPKSKYIEGVPGIPEDSADNKSYEDECSPMETDINEEKLADGDETNKTLSDSLVEEFDETFTEEDSVTEVGSTISKTSDSEHIIPVGGTSSCNLKMSNSENISRSSSSILKMSDSQNLTGSSSCILKMSDSQNLTGSSSSIIKLSDSKHIRCASSSSIMESSSSAMDNNDGPRKSENLSGILRLSSSEFLAHSAPSGTDETDGEIAGTNQHNETGHEITATSYQVYRNNETGHEIPGTSHQGLGNDVSAAIGNILENITEKVVNSFSDHFTRDHNSDIADNPAGKTEGFSDHITGDHNAIADNPAGKTEGFSDHITRDHNDIADNQDQEQTLQECLMALAEEKETEIANREMSDQEMVEKDDDSNFELLPETCGVVDNDITNSQLDAIDWNSQFPMDSSQDFESTSSVNQQQSSRNAVTSTIEHGNTSSVSGTSVPTPAHVPAKPGPATSSTDRQLEDGSAILNGIIREVSQLNKIVLKAKRDMDAARRQRPRLN